MRETSLWVRAGVEKRFQMETATYVERYHLGGQWATLADIFVEPRLLAEPPPVELSRERPLPARDLIYLWPELAGRVVVPPVPTMNLRQLLLRGRRVVLTSPPGSGKTTLLAYCAHLCAHAGDTGPFTFLLPVMPVFVHLAELDLDRPEGAEAGADTDPVAPLVAALHNRTGPLTAPGVGSLLREKLAAGHLLLLLDGGDEIAAHQFPVTWLADLLARYPQMQVIVAGHWAGYGPLLDLDFTVSGLLPWRQGEADACCRGWAAALSLSTPPNREQFWQPGRTALETTMHLWRGIDLFATKKPVAEPQPAGNYTLYASVLAGWRAAFNGTATTPESDPNPLWSNIAYELLAQNRLYLRRPEVEMLVEKDSVSRPETESPARTQPRHNQAHWKHMQQSSLFVSWAGERVAFRCPVWRDYLAAGYLATHEMWDTVQARRQDPQWAGVLRFYTGRCGEQNLSQALLDSRSSDPLRNGLFQVAGWLPHMEPAEAWRRQALIQLGQMIVQSGVPQVLRQRAAAALSLTGEKGVPALLHQLMQRAEPELRQAAALAMVHVDEAVAFPALEKLLLDGVSAVREMAVYCLGWLPQEASERPILLALIDRDLAVSRAAALVLAGRGEAGWQFLREAAADPAVHIRRAAVHGLAALDVYWAVELLQTMSLEDKEWMVKSTATLALEEIAARNRPEPWRPQPAGEQIWLLEWAARQQQTVPAGAAAVPLLCDLVAGDEKPKIRALAARSLGQVQLAPGQVATVQQALQDGWADRHEGVRDAAFFSWTRLVRAYGTMTEQGNSGHEAGYISGQEN